MTTRARYAVVKDSPDMLVIRDLGPWDRHLTVTNDVESVVADLYASGRLVAGRRLLCYDSESDLDEIVHADGRFVRFAPGPGRVQP